jgi:hypothetical protein
MTKLTTPERNEAAVLHDQWERACDMIRSTSGDYGISKAEEWEEQCFDMLVSYLESNDLNYSEYDPRSDAHDYAADEAESRNP